MGRSPFHRWLAGCLVGAVCVGNLLADDPPVGQPIAASARRLPVGDPGSSPAAPGGEVLILQGPNSPSVVGAPTAAPIVLKITETPGPRASAAVATSIVDAPTIGVPVASDVVEPIPAFGLPLPARVSPVAADAPARPAFPRTERRDGRKSYVDLTAAPCFGHADDYSWLIGQVEYSAVAKQWRLRYASVDEFDRYGGRLVLIENQHLSHLKDGMYVHLRGHVVNPDSPANAPTYFRIEWFRVVENPNAVQNGATRPN